MNGAIGSLLIWLSGVATLGALLIARELCLRGRDPPMPPATSRQIRAAARRARLQLPSLYEIDPADEEYR